MSVLGGIGKDAGATAAQTIADAAENIAGQVTATVDRTTETIRDINDTDIRALADAVGQILTLLRQFGKTRITHELSIESGSIKNIIQIEVPEA